MPDAYRLLSPRPMASRVLVLYPFAGAGAHVFQPWVSFLPADIEPWALQLPGREDRLGQAPIGEWEEALSTARKGLASLSAGRKIVLYGHSLGALFVQALGASAAGVQIERRILGAPPRRVLQPARTDEDMLARLEAHYGPLPTSFADPEIKAATLPALRADLDLLEKALTFDVVPDQLLLGRDDPSTPDSRAAFAGVEITEMPGGHYFALTHPKDCVAALFGSD